MPCTARAKAIPFTFRPYFRTLRPSFHRMTARMAMREPCLPLTPLRLRYLRRKKSERIATRTPASLLPPIGREAMRSFLEN
jgi:hypothetical protein